MADDFVNIMNEKDQTSLELDSMREPSQRESVQVSKDLTVQKKLHKVPAQYHDF